MNSKKYTRQMIDNFLENSAHISSNQTQNMSIQLETEEKIMIEHKSERLLYK